MITDIIKGARYALAGFSLVNTRGIRRYVAIPLCINISLFIVGIYFAYGQANTSIAQLVNWLPDWLDWLSWLMWLLFAAVMSIVVFFTFTLLSNLLGSPFNGLLAEKLEQKLTGNPPPSGGRFIESLRGIQSAIISEFSKFGYLVSRAIPLIVISFIPVLNVLSPLLWFGFGAWMLALEYMDYPMGNHGFSFREQREVAKQKCGIALGFGGAVVVITMIPILNFVAMPVAVAGATKLWVETFANEKT